MLIGLSAFGQTPKKRQGVISDTTTYIISKETNSYKHIEPGKAIGHIVLFSDAGKSTAEWGEPDRKITSGDISVSTWYDEHDSTGHSLTIYAGQLTSKRHTVDNVVKQIRITSPKYKTINDVRTGMTLAEIKTIYKLVPHQWAGRKVYDDVRAGIAFEFDGQNKCTAIIVHAPNALF
ncbi:hypothetical protein C8P68_102808 [Mucilaginibacter yixingensis]|uniref:Uncharacterized protein n=2 Tax=Mucilaginibacter yixingensis TaxID=1295612 RepID=A0A2T5JDY2_9SPHI|nr:hypothetical protein C8P68_102808 [Mucilaginibacter yixingensis]